MTSKNIVCIFSKPDCPYCKKAKDILRKHHLPFDDIDINESSENKALVQYLSSAATVPQIFFGKLHIGGSDMLMKLDEENLIEVLTAAQTDPLNLDTTLSEKKLQELSADFVLRDIISEVDASHSHIPEDQPILRLYKKFFGFWPNCFYYQYHWPEVAYRQFVYCHNVGAIAGGKNIVGAPVMNALGYATSNAHGCNYCQIHSASVGDEHSASNVNFIDRARDGDFADNNPYGPFEATLADLVAKATTNSVTSKDIENVYAARKKAKFTRFSARTNIKAASMIAAAFGFLNVFNDLTGVKVEKAWADKTKEKTNIDTGRHGHSDDTNASNLDYDIPSGPPYLLSMTFRYWWSGRAGLKGTEHFIKQHLGVYPNWIKQWPAILRPLHARFYVGVMTDVDDKEADKHITPELKHLMLRVSAINKLNEYQGAIEGLLAYQSSKKDDRALRRIKYAYQASILGEEPGDLFTEHECAALRLARLSANTPLITPLNQVKVLGELFSEDAIIRLITVCAMASMIQRYLAIEKPTIDIDAKRFLLKNKIAIDVLQAKYIERFPRSD